MAAAAVETVSIVVDDQEIQVPKGEMVVESVKRLGLEIPIFCYHPRLKPVGMCRMCLVEVGFKGPDGTVRKMPKPQAACTLPAQENLVVYTDSELVRKDRKGVLELLLINHPLDCPICDRGGECPLQNNTIFYGPSTSRFTEMKRHAHKAYPLSDYVTLDLERCIQCGRCVRFTEEISGDSELAFRFRGGSMQPSTFGLRHFGSKFSGNVIEICPVGALTNKEYRFRARPWDLETSPGICTKCSVGCSVWFDHRVGQIMRVNGRTHEDVNEEWTCDRGKFGFADSGQRILKPLIRRGDRLEECTWPEAYSEILHAFQGAGDKAALIGGPDLSNESAFFLKKMMSEAAGSSRLGFRFTRHAPSEAPEAKLGMKSVGVSIAELEDRDSILVFGTSLADDVPILHLRVRKAWFTNGAKVFVACDRDTDADSFAHTILRYRPGTEETLAGGILRAVVDSGKGTVPAATLDSLPTVSGAAEATGVSEDAIRAVAAEIGATCAIITSDAILNSVDAIAAIENLAGLALVTGAGYSRFGTTASSQGFVENGWSASAEEILDGCGSGEVEALWLAGAELFESGLEDALVTKALNEVPFLVVHASHQTESFHYASVVLPMTPPSEQEGSFTNCERRVQRLGALFGAKGESRPAWKAAAEILVRAGKGAPVFNAGEAFAHMAGSGTPFEGLKLDELGTEGALLE